MIKKILLVSLISTILITGFFSVNKVYAADPTCEQQCAGLKQIGTSGARDVAGESYKCCMTTCANKSTEFGLCIGIDNPLGQKKEIKDILASIIKTVIEIVLPIVVVMVIYSGFLYVLARGKPEAIERAHKTLTWTLVGAAILLGAQLIANVLVDTISQIGDDSGYNSKTTTVDNTGTGGTGGVGATGTCTDGIINGDETGIDTGGRCATGNNTTVPDYITNLTFNRESETSTTATGKFSYFVSSNFTPDVVSGKSTLELYCYDAGNVFTLDSFNPEPSSTTLTAGTHKTTASYTIKNKGDHVCYISYDVSGINKNINTPVIQIPSQSTNFASYIKNLSFTNDTSKETSTTSTGTFSYEVDTAFTPRTGSLVVACQDSNNNLTLNATLPDQSFTVGKYTTKSAYTIKGAGTNVCKIVYELTLGAPKLSDGISVKVPSTSNSSGNSSSDPTYIENLAYKIDTTKETSTDSPLTFTFDVTKDFTPDKNTFFLTCLPSTEVGKSIPNSSLGINFGNNLMKAQKNYSVTGDQIHIYIAGTHICSVSYKLGGVLKTSKEVSFKTPSTSGSSGGIHDPIGGSDFKIDNTLGAKIVSNGIDVSKNMIAYTIDVLYGDYTKFGKVGLTCVNINSPTTYLRDSFDVKLTKNSGNLIKSTLTGGSLTTNLKDFVCDVDFELNSDTQFYHSTWAFPLGYGYGNDKQYYK